jgi:hypothetical protein
MSSSENPVSVIVRTNGVPALIPTAAAGSVPEG